MADFFFIDAENLVPQAVESNFEEEKTLARWNCVVQETWASARFISNAASFSEELL